MVILCGVLMLIVRFGVIVCVLLPMVLVSLLIFVLKGAGIARFAERCLNPK